MRKSLYSLALISVFALANHSALAVTVTLTGGCKTGGDCYCTKNIKPKGLISKTYVSECHQKHASEDRLTNTYQDGQRADGAVANCLANCLGKTDASPSDLKKYEKLIKDISGRTK
jgi:hypothetical protein